MTTTTTSTTTTRSYRLHSVLLVATCSLLFFLSPVIACQVCLQEILSLAATQSPAPSFRGSQEADERYRLTRQKPRHRYPPSFPNSKLLSHRLKRVRRNVDNQVSGVLPRSKENGMLQTVFYASSNAQQSCPKKLHRNPAKHRSTTVEIPEMSAPYKSIKHVYISTEYSIYDGLLVASVLPTSPSISHNITDAEGPVSTRHQFSLPLESLHLAINPSYVLDEDNVENGDSDAEPDVPEEEEEEHNDLSDPDPTSKAMIATIGIYKNWISPLLPPACRFVPTCSRYGVQAIEEFGPTKGVILTAWRLLRCSPLGGKGYDPPKWPPVPYWYSSY